MGSCTGTIALERSTLLSDSYVGVEAFGGPALILLH